MDVGDNPAVALFLDRAAQAGRDLDGEPANLRHIARICHDLDGLPLAIELAAARTRSLSVADIAAWLTDHRFTLLSRGDRTAQNRPRGLREAVQWSGGLVPVHQLVRVLVEGRFPSVGTPENRPTPEGGPPPHPVPTP